jgi:eukaryotic-like serine/threonine-protein kinase
MSTPSESETTTPVPQDHTPALPPERSPGERVGDRFEILEILGRSELATSYLAADTDELERPTVALKLLKPSARLRFDQFHSRLTLAHQVEHRTLSRLIAWGLDGDHPYLALEYLKGQTLSQSLQKKQEAGARFLPRTALSLLSPVCHALAAIHHKLPHGALTPGNIYVERNGRVRLANLGFGWLAEVALRDSGEGATVDSAFVAPEVRRDPEAATPKGDLFSLGMITIALLSGRLPGTSEAGDVADHLLQDVPESLRGLLASCIAQDPAERPDDVSSFFERLQDAIEDLRDQMIHQSLEHEAVGESTGEASAAGAARSGLHGLDHLLVSGELPPVPEGEEDPAVWLVHRNGFDYGPFSSEQVRDQLLQDAIDEHTEVRNLETQERGVLGDVDEFAEFVADYLPIRDERRKREAERRAEVQRKVKRAGATGIITAIIGLLGLVGLYVYYIEFVRAKPEPIALESLFARVSRDFRAPASAYVGIAADPDLMAALFNFEEELEAPPPPARRRPRGQGTTLAASASEEDLDGADPLDRGTIDFSSAGGGRRLTPNDINATILQDGRALQRCLRDEITRNRSFGGTEMRFVIRPDGRTQAVDMGGGNYTEELRSCLVPIFRRMRFPEHDGLNLPVSFPFHVR